MAIDRATSSLASSKVLVRIGIVPGLSLATPAAAPKSGVAGGVVAVSAGFSAAGSGVAGVAGVAGGTATAAGSAGLSAGFSASVRSMDLVTGGG